MGEGSVKDASSTTADKRTNKGERAGTAVGLAGLLAAASLAAAGPADARSLTHAQTVDITGLNTMSSDSYVIDTHGTVAAGLVKIRFKNRGTMDHQAQLFRLNDGVSWTKFLTDLHSSNPFVALFGDSAAAGGAAVVHAGGDQTVWQALQGGTYAVICLVSDNGVPHFDLGMVAELTVAGSDTARQLAAVHPEGRVDGVIDAHDMTYTMPTVIRDGGLYRYQDTDAMDVHELTFGRLLPGKTAADAKAWFASFANPGGPSGPPPFVYEGGFGGEVPGGGGWLRADLEPGNYVAFCLVPDDKTGLPHAAMGMVVGFTAVHGDGDD
jgi:hypothetical protein